MDEGIPEAALKVSCTVSPAQETGKQPIIIKDCFSKLSISDYSEKKQRSKG